MRTEPAWRERSACRNLGVDPDMFFVSDEARRTKKNEKLTPLEQLAVDICAKCPVSGNCLSYALDNPQEVGIWGGTTTTMRKALRKVRSRASCPRCVRGRLMRLDDGVTQLCMYCGLSWHTE